MQMAKDRITALVILAAVAVGWMQTADIPAEPRFFPRAIILFMGALAALMLVKTFLKTDASTAPPFFADGRAFLLVTGMTIGLIWLITEIGFFVAAALFMTGFTLVFGYRKFTSIAATTTIFLGGLYLIFVVLLKRPLP